jgi:hypothetical protein
VTAPRAALRLRPPEFQRFHGFAWHSVSSQAWTGASLARMGVVGLGQPRFRELLRTPASLGIRLNSSTSNSVSPSDEKAGPLWRTDKPGDTPSTPSSIVSPPIPSPPAAPAAPPAVAAPNASDPSQSTPDTASILKLLSLAKPQWPLLTFGIICLTISTGVNLGIPWAIGRIIDFFAPGSNATLLFGLPLENATAALALVLLVGAIANSGRSVALRLAGQRTVLAIRQAPLHVSLA